jgi:type II secretory pathway pseudopilin PulG
MNNKKAAMFGLDARIALAIFGSLSVIAGAALYSAIKNTEITKTINQMQEVNKAVEAFYLDTGSHLEQGSAYYYPSRIDALLDNYNSLANWHGPYLPDYYSWGSVTLRNVVQNSKKMAASAYVLNNTDWDEGFGFSNQCSTGETCYFYLAFKNIYSINASALTADDLDLSIMQKIDEKIDGGDGMDTGSFRWNDGNSTFYLRSIPYANN